MKILKLFVMACVSVMLASCAGLTMVTVPQSNINFLNEDMETERFVEYTLTKSYYFGIGGMSEKAKNTNIIHELMKKADLQPNEALAYISVSKNINHYLFVTDVKYTASGYVVRPVNGEYRDPAYEATTDKAQRQLYNTYKRRINGALSADDLIKIKKDIEKDVSTNTISKELAASLFEKIAYKLSLK